MKGFSIIKRRNKVPNGMAYTRTVTGYCDIGYNFKDIVNEVRRLSGIDPDIEYHIDSSSATARTIEIKEEEGKGAREISIIKSYYKVQAGIEYKKSIYGYCEFEDDFQDVIDEVRRLSGINPDIECRENGYYASAQLTRIMKEREYERQRDNSEMRLPDLRG